MKQYAYLCLLCINLSISAQTVILASTFNQTFSEQNPLMLTETTTIELDEDIDVSGEIIKADVIFGLHEQDRLIFHSSSDQQVKIIANTNWNLTSFNNTNHAIEFTGNAQLAFGLGSTLWLENENIVFKDMSRMIPAKISNSVE